MRKILFGLMVLMLTAGISYANIPKSRSFEFDYQVKVKDIPKDATELKIWIPQLPTNQHQVVEDIVVDPQEGVVVSEENGFNNKMFYYEIKAPFKEEYTFNVSYKVKRSEYSQKTNDVEDFSKFLKANKLVTLSPRIKDLANEVTQGKETTMDKARAIYDYVYNTVEYNKEIPGWGYGDTERVCDLRAGNCTDFHSLFISLARASGIPARFYIGVPFDEEKLEGETAKYHCWAEFYDEQKGWIPVDISEAWKDKSKYEYYFGTIGESRLEFSTGRDIVLEPKQAGEPLNYFIYPYAELDGEIFKKVGVLFKYKVKQDQQG